MHISYYFVFLGELVSGYEVHMRLRGFNEVVISHVRRFPNVDDYAFNMSLLVPVITTTGKYCKSIQGQRNI